MKKILLSIVGLLVICGAAMPLIVKNQIDKQIETEKQVLNKHGVELSLISEKGYVSSFREFELTIVDGKKFRDYVFEKLTQANPNYKSVSQLLKKQSEKDIRPALDGTTLYGTLKSSNLLLHPSVIKISLTKFSDEIMSSLNSSSKTDELIQSILDEKMFTFLITLDSNKKISQIVMQDINKDIINHNNDVLNVKLKNHKLNIDIQESLKGTYTLGEQSVKAKKFSFKTLGVEYKFDYLTQFDNRGSFHIDSIEFKENKNAVTIGNIDASAMTKTSNLTSLDGEAKYNIKDISIKNRVNLELNNLALGIVVSGLDKNSTIEASNSYNELAFKPTQNSIKQVQNSIQKILNIGFKVGLEASLHGLIFANKNFDNSDLILNFKIEPNNYNINDKNMLNAFLVDGKLTLNENSVKELLKINRNFTKFAQLGKKDGKNIVFTCEFKNSTLFINGTKVK